MYTDNIEFRRLAQTHLDRYYGAHPNIDQQARAHDALRFLASDDQPVKGKPDHWAAGILYALGEWDNPHRHGKDNPLKRDLLAMFKIDPGHLTRRAGEVKRKLHLFPEDRDLNKVIHQTMEVIQAWMPCVREHEPKLLERFPSFTVLFSLINTEKSSPNKRGTSRKR